MYLSIDVESIVICQQIFRAKDLLDNTLAFIKNAMSGAIIDPDRLVIGTEEGLFCLDLDRSGKWIVTYIATDFAIVQNI